MKLDERDLKSVSDFLAPHYGVTPEAKRAEIEIWNNVYPDVSTFEYAGFILFNGRGIRKVAVAVHFINQISEYRADGVTHSISRRGWMSMLLLLREKMGIKKD